MTAPDLRTTRLHALRPPGEPHTLVLAISGPITRAGIPSLCDRVRLLLQEGDIDHVVCDVRGVIDPDATAIDALARLQLGARRLGCELRLSHACRELRELLALTGLRDVLPLQRD